MRASSDKTSQSLSASRPCNPYNGIRVGEAKRPGPRQKTRMGVEGQHSDASKASESFALSIATANVTAWGKSTRKNRHSKARLFLKRTKAKVVLIQEHKLASEPKLLLPATGVAETAGRRGGAWPA